MATIPSELVTSYIGDNPSAFNVQVVRYNIPAVTTVNNTGVIPLLIASPIAESTPFPVTATSANRLKIPPGLYVISVRVALDSAIPTDKSIRSQLQLSNDLNTIVTIPAYFNINELAPSEFFVALFNIPTGGDANINIFFISSDNSFTRNVQGTEVYLVRLNVY